MATAAQLRTRLKVALGRRRDTVLLDDETLDVWLDEALRELNKHFPRHLIASFPTVVGTQAYDLSELIEGYRSAVEVYWDPNGIKVDVGPAAETSDSGIIQYAGAFVDMAAARLRTWRDSCFGATATVIGDAVYLDPVPTKVANVYVLYNATRYEAVTNVDDKGDQAFMAYAEFPGHTSLSVGDGATRTVSGPSGVSVTTDAAAHHKDAAEKAYRRFLDSLPPLPTFRAQL